MFTSLTSIVEIISEKTEKAQWNISQAARPMLWLIYKSLRQDVSGPMLGICGRVKTASPKDKTGYQLID